MNILMGILLALIGILLFSLVIFCHELGHFLLAKFSGVRVNEFALGMGPKILSRQKGETLYSLRAFPIGGFCAMEGEDEDTDDERAFSKRPVWKRVLVIVAGGVFNIILGFVLMLIVHGQEDIYATTRIAKFAEGSALQSAGVQVGDEITEIDGYAVFTDRDLTFALALANPDAMSLKVNRDGQTVDLGTIRMNSRDAENGKKIVALDFSVVGEERTVWGLVKRSAADTVSMTRMVIESLKGILTGRFGLNELAGPVGTAQVIAQAASEGLKDSFGAAVNNILFMIIMITVNLGIVNLLPLPALDGGRLVFLLWEGVTRKPVPAKYEGYVHAAGFVLLIGAMVLIAFNDIVRIVTG